MLTVLLASILALKVAEVRRLPTQDATQGVASDGEAIYAVSNHAIARLDIKDGHLLARWEGDPAQFKHLNSCSLDGDVLVCAASNYPAVPMASYIERFDAVTLRYLGRQTLAPGHGSLTWAMHRRGGWWAGFANYDGKGGEPGRDHRNTMLVHYNERWKPLTSWRFPESVLERLAPRSASGGVWGDDGLLYVTGHDRPELYVLRAPIGGGTLEHVATIAIPTGGQAIGWDPRQPRLLWSIERATRDVVASSIPPVR